MRLIRAYARHQADAHSLGGYCLRKRLSRIHRIYEANEKPKIIIHEHPDTQQKKAFNQVYDLTKCSGATDVWASKKLFEFRSDG